MKVAALTIDYPPQRFIGSEMATHAMLAALVAAGHEVAVTTMGRTGESWELDGVKVSADLKNFKASARSSDVVVSHVELAGRLPTVKPLVGITHNAMQYTVEAAADPRWSLVIHNAQATAVACAASRIAPWLLVHPPVHPDHYRIARPGANAITLVNVTAEKGSRVFYEVAAAMPSHQFIGVIGGWGAPDLRQAPNVELVDHGADMRSVYTRTRVLMMPSRHESWGRVAVEAMTSGIPVVASALPGLAECLGDSGRLVDRDDVEGWVQTLIDLDDAGRYERESAAAAARSRELDPTAQLGRFLACIEALAAGAQGPWEVDRRERWRNLGTGSEVVVTELSAQRQRLALSDRWALEGVV